MPHLVKVVQRLVQVGEHSGGGLVGDLDGGLQNTLRNAPDRMGLTLLATIITALIATPTRFHKKVCATPSLGSVTVRSCLLVTAAGEGQMETESALNTPHPSAKGELSHKRSTEPELSVGLSAGYLSWNSSTKVPPSL